MSDFRNEILADIDWRLFQLATAKTLPFRYSLSDVHREFLIKYTVPTIYAVWEGFVKNSFEIYVRELNRLGLNMNQICINIVSHSLEKEFPQFKEPPSQFPKLVNFFEKLTDYYLDEDFKINPKIPTESNVNLKVINNILFRFNLELLPDEPFNAELNKLLQFRNSISHGDSGILVAPSNIHEFTSTVNNLMYEIYMRVDKGYSERTYLK